MSLLEGAYARVDRIEAKHLEFKTLSDEWVNSKEGQVVGDRYLEQRASRPPHKRQQIRAEVPPVLAIVAGEAIYNLRSALDYLAYELVFLDKGDYFEKSQFPIDDTGARRLRYCRETMERLEPCHRAAIEALQPANGCEWTGILRDLSNPDKHRKLTTFDVDLAPRVWLHSNTDADVNLTTVEVQRGVAFTIVFDAIGPVYGVLERLKASVSDVLDAFKPEFEAKGL